MKRWQDRGEVLDSDEEDWSLEEEWSALEPVRKRARLEDVENHTPTEQPEEGTEYHDETEQTPTEAEHHLKQPQSDAESTPKVVAQNGQDHADEEAGLAAATDDEELPWTNGNTAVTYARRGKLPKRRTTRARELIPVIAQTEQDEAVAGHTNNVADPDSHDVSQGPRNPADTTDTLQVEPGEISTQESHPPTSEPLAFGDLISRASTPLSDPPESPQVSPRKGAMVLYNSRPNIEAPRSRRASSVDTDLTIHPNNITIPPTQGAGGRSLRIRSEKQIHPYLHEAAVYKRQCRERGLKPVKAVVDQIMNKAPAPHRPDSGVEHQSVSSQAPPSSSSASMSSADAINNGRLPASVPSPRLLLGAPGSDEELPDIETLIRRGQAEGQRFGTKRRKLTHPAHRTRVSSSARDETGANLDDFSVPPSPPTSSHDSATSTQAPQRPTGFRLPRGVSPLPLPTPQISSDTRPSHTRGFRAGDDSEHDSEPAIPPRTVTKSGARRPTVIAIPDESSSDASESASGNEEGQLKQQRRRIRGVLPASWLRMDQKAQTKGKPSTDHRPAESPVRAASTQKGVARRLTKRRVPSPSRAPLRFSDDEQSQDSDAQPPEPRTSIHSRPAAAAQDLKAFPTATVEDDDMEVDFIDPMLPGPSRHKKDVIFRKRQPRIDDALSRVRNGSNDLSEERNAFRKMRGASTEKSVSRKRKKARNPRSRSSHVQLGILDAPASPDALTIAQPQFVRLAARQARQASNQGRGSPSHKTIRLATHNDTEDANLHLRAWRQGKLTQRTDRPRKRNAVYETARTSAPPRQAMPAPSTAAHDEQQVTNMPPQDFSARESLVDDAAAPSTSTRTPGIPQTLAGEPTGHMQHTLSDIRPRERANRWPIVQYRGAQLESLASGQDQADPSALFQRRVQCLTEAVSRRAKTPAQPSLSMKRLLQDKTPAALPEEPPERAQAIQIQQNVDHTSETRARGYALPRRPRKRPTARKDVDTREFRQPSEPLPDFNHPINVEEDTAPTQATLQGLGPLGTRYSTDFDVRPLPQGTFFHQSTFIGSGDLAASLQLSSRDLDTGAGSPRIYINGIMHEWAAWTEEVSSAAASIPSAIASVLKDHIAAPASQQADQSAGVVSNVDHMLRSVVRYLSKCVRFYDPIDRKGCAQCIKDLVDGILELDSEHALWTGQCQRLRQRVLQYAVVMARQCCILCESTLVSSTLRSSSDETLRSAATKLASLLMSGGLDELRSLYDLCRSLAVRESGLRDDDSVLAGLAILSHCLSNCRGQSPSFWGVIGNSLPAITASANVAHMEKRWQELLTLLPVLDFDASGLIGGHRKLQAPHCDWTLTKQLLDSCLGLYPATSVVPGSSVNDYVRALLNRCYKLVVTWRWFACEATLGAIYDFFARRGLCLLQREEGRGSPAFLEDISFTALDRIEMSGGDHSFHVFLKLLAVALTSMHKHQVYTDKKISGIIWRFIPNHARMYRRDAEVRQTDLDALRNHCDLLCTLYIASPPAHRLRLDLLRNLVDHSSSHREACRISVKAWAHVASFQSSTNESLQMLDTPAQWFREMLQTTANQYRVARTEAEQEYTKARAEGSLGVTDELLERTVSSNQRQIAATLVDLIAALKRAVASARTLSAAAYLLEHADPWQAVSSFSLAERRLQPVFHELLDLIAQLREVQKHLASGSDSQAASDDSQDYGDFAAFEEFAATQEVPAADPSMAVLIIEPVSQLLSNAFGAELSPGDELLTKVVNVWIDFASELVKKGLRTWSNFIDDYSAGAWLQLRDTEQRRSYTPHVLSRIAAIDHDAPKQLTDVIFATWLRSLVERESRLKFQHVLTAALMNACPDEPVMRNLPFSKTSHSHDYHITLQNLRERRLALLSSVLSNMREAFDDTLYNQPQMLPALKRRYGDYLRQLMQAMKNNYQDVQVAGDDAVAEAGVSGAYVGFVQQVVSFLQQYTTGICTIDKFFVDSSAFPLPATDPTYVVGRLKSYVPKLAEAKSRKQLAVFVHTVSERAAVASQQGYLVDQFVAAMSGVLERGDPHAPSLRHVLLTAVFPAYIENALSTACSWILAVPILDATARIIRDLLYDTAMDSSESVTAAVEQMEATLRSIQRAIAPTLVHLGLLVLPHVQRALAAMFNLCQASLTVAGHFQRASTEAASLKQCLTSLKAYARASKTRLSDAEDEFFEPPADTHPSCDGVWPDTRVFSKKQLQDSLANNWHANDGQYFLRQGNSSTEVVAPLMEDDVERRKLLEAIGDFRAGMKRQKHRTRRVEVTKMSGVM